MRDGNVCNFTGVCVVYTNYSSNSGYISDNWYDIQPEFGFLSFVVEGFCLKKACEPIFFNLGLVPPVCKF